MHGLDGMLHHKEEGVSRTGAGLIAPLLAMLGMTSGHAAQLAVTVLDRAGQGVAGVVIIAEPDRKVGAAPPTAPVVMDQRHMQFVPEILVIRTGTSVDFPNSDQIRHQVYSFSAPKSFQLSLYAGRKYPPVLFDRAGLVTVGCNIHDNMVGYIYVTDSPYAGLSDEAGTLRWNELPAGHYHVTIWSPRLQETTGTSVTLDVSLAEADHATPVVRLSRPLGRDPQSQAGDMRWHDY